MDASSRAYMNGQGRQVDGARFVNNQQDNSRTLSGSEFALRVALCDLVERLKRSEQTCKYLEQCRNELAKEVIRLRQENAVISKENSLSSTIIQNELLSRANADAANTRNSFAANVAGRKRENDSVEAKRVQAINELELLRNATETDESWEEITVRLLRQLQEEMKAPPAISLDSKLASEPKVDQSGEARTVQRPRVYLAHSDVSTSTTQLSEQQQLRKGSECEMQTKQITVNEPIPPTASTLCEQFLSFQVHEAKNLVKSVMKQSSSPTDSKATSGNHNTTGESCQSKDSEAIDYCCKVLSTMAVDIDSMWHRMSYQNDKLTKLKNKQLRSYFKRQLNADGTISQGHSKMHLEHV
ncbi:hypothetical protein HDE_12268 [Halotydeus destructor]|nr:hypothetical protein HDE_12268 [Halotydeus destructor]